MEDGADLTSLHLPPASQRSVAGDGGQCESCGGAAAGAPSDAGGPSPAGVPIATWGYVSTLGLLLLCDDLEEMFFDRFRDVLRLPYDSPDDMNTLTRWLTFAKGIVSGFLPCVILRTPVAPLRLLPSLWGLSLMKKQWFKAGRTYTYDDFSAQAQGIVCGVSLYVLLPFHAREYARSVL